MRKALAATIVMLLLAACGSAPITAGPPHTPGSPGITNGGDVSLDFLQNGERIGGLNVRAGSGDRELVRFFVELPFAGQDYRLDSITLELTGEGVQPLIMLEPSQGTLTENISFSRVDSTVRLVVPDTDRHGDGTILFNLLASRDAFGTNGIRLHADLRFGAGDAEADLVIRLAP